jgi:hypothetical protein
MARLHLVGDAAGEVVLEERPALPHHVPVVLPADQVAEVGGTAWLARMFCIVKGAADNSSTTAMTTRCGSRWQISPRFARRARRDDEYRDHRSSSATANPATNSATTSPLAWRVMSNAVSGRWLGMGGARSAGLPLEPGEHDTRIRPNTTTAFGTAAQHDPNHFIGTAGG